MEYDRDPNNPNLANTTNTVHSNTAELRQAKITDVPHAGDSMTTAGAYDRPAHRSNAMAYIIGGLIIALGLLAFLVYGGETSDDVTQTGSTTTQTDSIGSGGANRSPGGSSGMSGAATSNTTVAPAPTAPAPRQ